MNKKIFYERDNNCLICGTNKFLEFNCSIIDFLISDGYSVIMTKPNKCVGVIIDEEHKKEICYMCFKLLVKLESTSDLLWWQLIDEPVYCNTIRKFHEKIKKNKLVFNSNEHLFSELIKTKNEVVKNDCC